MHDWYALFDEVKKLGSYHSDARLAEALALTRAQISAWRTGKSDLGTLSKLRILDALGHDDVRSAVLSLLPEKNRETLIQQHLELVARVARGTPSVHCGPAENHASDAAPSANRLLAALSDGELDRLVPHLVPVELALGQVLHRQGEILNQVYLPTTAACVIFHSTKTGTPVGLAMVGNDGLVGLPACIGEPRASNRVIVQEAGYAYRLDAEVARREFSRAGNFQRLLLRYTQALLAQMSQIAVCGHHHSPLEQLCRWLLQTLDRLDSDTVQVSRKVFPGVLGVNGALASGELRRLEADGAIRYRPGLITILDRAAIEHRACECHRVLKRNDARMFGIR
ncbi:MULTISPECIES: Crp/Fnr family transcriptional regulator [Burkholderia cepacia complex]|uniref:Crp/Fnr family transcriptional regulator n=1 Tax=Burkholderia cepacia complex TaxID=87882 RepID=UPI00075608FD|nr:MULTISPECIES: Crp/Fnr family transcriptional regulator [Burkholderia cepacia complex]AOI62029.1 cyclic nucleotide-binding protein [Burkholderia diffusa]AOI67970.1 cyclic nucleotide-binding protein [Burkholderia territorii]KVQ63082.1 cyclic nucleotide-binding protein [Burkholderia territorii]